MLRSLFRQSIVAFLLGGFIAAASAQSVTVSRDSALTAVVRHFGWLEAQGLKVVWTAAGEPADYSVASAHDLVTLSAVGQRPKAIYVLSRDSRTGAARFLRVAETHLAQHGEQARTVLSAVERARLWVLAEPAAAFQLIGGAEREQNFAGSRPGPAQMAELREAALSKGIDVRDAVTVLDDSVYRSTLHMPKARDLLLAASRP